MRTQGGEIDNEIKGWIMRYKGQIMREGRQLKDTQWEHRVEGYIIIEGTQIVKGYITRTQDREIDNQI